MPRSRSKRSRAGGGQQDIPVQGQKRLPEIAAHQRKLDKEPRNFAALYGLGLAHLASGAFEAALAHIDKALSENPNVAEAQNASGLALLQLNRPQHAIERFEKALALEPDLAEARVNIGLALLHLGKNLEAADRFEWALAIAPRHAVARRSLGMAYARLGHHDKACAQFQAALAISPDMAAAHVDLGISLEALDRHAQALDSYDRALAIDASFANAHYNRGIVLERLGRLEEARLAAERAVVLDPTEMRHHFSFSLLHRYTDGDRHLAAMQTLSADMASRPPKAQIELRFALSKALADVGRSAESFTHLAAAHALQRVRNRYDERTALAVFDRIRAAFPPTLLCGKQGQGFAKSAPIFVLGMPRSGTTLVEQILASHPDVFGAGELKDLGRAIENFIGRERMLVPFPEFAPLLSQWHLTHLGAEYAKMIAARAPDAKRIVDKMPSNFHFVGLIYMALPNARVIHVRRDPADTCFSIYSRYFVEDFPYAHDFGELGRYYKAYDRLMAHWRAVLPPNFLLEVQYEDVVANLEGQTRRMLAHCGLEWNEACLNFHQTDRAVMTASAAQVRQPIYRSSIGSWRRHEQHLRPLLEALDDAGDKQRSGEPRADAQQVDTQAHRSPAAGAGARKPLPRRIGSRAGIGPRTGRQQLRRLAMSMALVAAGLVALVIGDDLLSSGRYSNVLVNDAVSGVLEVIHR